MLSEWRFCSYEWHASPCNAGAEAHSGELLKSRWTTTRGIRKKAEVETSAESFSECEENAAAAAVLHSSQAWTMLIK